MATDLLQVLAGPKPPPSGRISGCVLAQQLPQLV